MSNRQFNHRGNEGFTLIEVMIALAILGMSLFVLLDMHYNAIHVQSRLEQEIRVRNLISLATGISEVEIAAGNLQGSEEFGDRYPGWSYSFDAEEFDSSSSSSSSTASPAFPGLYYVVVKVQDPDKVEYNLEYYTVVRTQVTAQGNPDDDDDGGSGGTGSGGTGSGGTGSGGTGSGGTGSGGVGN